MKSELEIRRKINQLETQIIRKVKAESQTYGTIEYFEDYDKRVEELKEQIKSMHEVNILKWVLNESS